MIHSNICDSEKLATVSYAAEALYYRLLTRVDDNGNFTADARIVYGQCVPLREDMTPKKVQVLLEELATNGGAKAALIQFYEIDGDKFLHITKFEDFQYLRNDRMATVKYPVHPNFMGPTVPSQPPTTVNQGDTTGIPEGGIGWQKISKEKLREEKIREEKISKESAGNASGDSCSQNELPAIVEGGGCDWKMLGAHFQRAFRGKFASKTKRNQAEYQRVCALYGEALVLAAFDRWAEQNASWAIAKTDPLFFFWKQLPEAAEAAKMDAEDKQASVGILTDTEKEKLMINKAAEDKIKADAEYELKRKEDEIKQREIELNRYTI